MDSALVVFFTLALILALWAAICFVSSTLGGWRSLARHYQQLRPFDGRRWRFSSGSMGLVSYGYCLTLGASPEGLFLAVPLPLRLGHPPLFILWSEVESVEPYRLFFFSMVRFRFKRAPKVSLAVFRKLAMAIAKESSLSTTTF